MMVVTNFFKFLAQNYIIPIQWGRQSEEQIIQKVIVKSCSDSKLIQYASLGILNVIEGFLLWFYYHLPQDNLEENVNKNENINVKNQNEINTVNKNETLEGTSIKKLSLNSLHLLPNSVSDNIIDFQNDFNENKNKIKDLTNSNANSSKENDIIDASYLKIEENQPKSIDLHNDNKTYKNVMQIKPQLPLDLSNCNENKEHIECVSQNLIDSGFVNQLEKSKSIQKIEIPTNSIKPEKKEKRKKTLNKYDERDIIDKFQKCILQYPSCRNQILVQKLEHNYSKEAEQMKSPQSKSMINVSFEEEPKKFKSGKIEKNSNNLSLQTGPHLTGEQKVIVKESVEQFQNNDKLIQESHKDSQKNNEETEDLSQNASFARYELKQQDIISIKEDLLEPCNSNITNDDSSQKSVELFEQESSISNIEQNIPQIISNQQEQNVEKDFQNEFFKKPKENTDFLQIKKNKSALRNDNKFKLTTSFEREPSSWSNIWNDYRKNMQNLYLLPSEILKENYVEKSNSDISEKSDLKCQESSLTQDENKLERRDLARKINKNLCILSKEILNRKKQMLSELCSKTFINGSNSTHTASSVESNYCHGVNSEKSKYSFNEKNDKISNDKCLSPRKKMTGQKYQDNHPTKNLLQDEQKRKFRKYSYKNQN